MSSDKIGLLISFLPQCVHVLVYRWSSIQRGKQIGTDNQYLARAHDMRLTVHGYRPRLQDPRYELTGADARPDSVATDHWSRAPTSSAWLSWSCHQSRALQITACKLVVGVESPKAYIRPATHVHSDVLLEWEQKIRRKCLHFHTLVPCLHESIRIQAVDPADMCRRRLGFADERFDLLLAFLFFGDREVLSYQLELMEILQSAWIYLVDDCDKHL